jgi:hypothetical protein
LKQRELLETISYRLTTELLHDGFVIQVGYHGFGWFEAFG